MSVYKGITFLQIVDALSTIMVEPRSLFDVVEPPIPSDRICNVFPEAPVQLVIGPSFMARDLAAYNGMIDMAAEQFTASWERIDWGRPKPNDDEA